MNSFGVSDYPWIWKTKMVALDGHGLKHRVALSVLLRFEEEVEVKLIITEIRDRSIAYAFQFWKDEDGERVKAAVGEVVAACVRFDQASGSMTPIMIPEVVKSKISP